MSIKVDVNITFASEKAWSEEDIKEFIDSYNSEQTLLEFLQ